MIANVTNFLNFKFKNENEKKKILPCPDMSDMKNVVLLKTNFSVV